MPLIVKTSRVILIFTAVAVLAGAAVLAIRQSDHPDSQSIFWDALRANLTQTALTCSVSQITSASTTGPGTAATAPRLTQQRISLDLIGRHNLQATTTIKQQNTSVTTEEIDTQAVSYVRYTAIQSPQIAADGKKLDFNRALNVWSKSAVASPTSTLFGRTALGNCVVPLAKLTDVQAATILQQMQSKRAFSADFAKVTKTTLDKQSVEVYVVTVQPRAYIDLMKHVGQLYGLHELDSVNAADYDKKKPQQMKFYLSQSPARIVKIDYTTSQHTINFSGFGVQTEIVLPKTTITADELQQRLQAQK